MRKPRDILVRIFALNFCSQAPNLIPKPSIQGTRQQLAEPNHGPTHADRHFLNTDLAALPPFYLPVIENAVKMSSDNRPEIADTSILTHLDEDALRIPCTPWPIRKDC